MTFAGLLRDAMVRGGYSIAALHRASGIAEGTLAQWLGGKRQPTLQRADLLAELLDAPLLARVMLNVLRRRCVRCRKVFYADARNIRHTRYCGRTCRTAEYRHRTNGKRSTIRPRLAVIQRAVAEHCAWCEPQGICRTAECALRPVSPLPLVAR